MKLLLSKYAIWIYSLIVFLAIGLVLDIATIGAEEYALFDNGMKAANDAKFLRTINSFYFPTILVSHLFVLTIFVFKKTRTR
ncbi:hypothetical protein BKP45_07610 [Anaerobacillus alkalidiazotrophicus]|uniref:Uncharacterized protein n=1 Tax=Anaerobacillus alkalidiazotrophicus TaxID=472963 RepID=A0A1S2M881_9BACI|nr:hypothetical protein [Anaerobacillus alkalidiazotrophicus]OIJ20958.1 hypothetical protein BKP45_07610 [Anaerobacillus alkalidiazotrophicus]